MTLNQVINRLSAIVGAHKQLRSFAYVQSVSDYIAQGGKKVTYPICVIEHNSGAISSTNHLLTHTLRFYLLDLVNRANETDLNEQDVISDMHSIAEDMVALVRDPAYLDTWFTDGDAGLTVISDYTQDYVAGVAFDLPLSTYFLGDRCAVPADGLPPDTVDIITTGRDWTLVQFTNTADTNVLTIAAIQGKRLLELWREDMPQIPVTVPTPLGSIDFDNPEEAILTREVAFDSSAATLTWATGNNLFIGEVITLIVK